jgi:hypothetical protein
MDVGGFDSVLGDAHEQRYRTRLAATGVSCLAPAAGPPATGLLTDPSSLGGVDLLAALANAAQSLRTPVLWSGLTALGAALAYAKSEVAPGSVDARLIDRQWTYLARIVRELGLGHRIGDRSPLPALALFHAGLEAGARHRGGPAPDCVGALRSEVVSAAASASAFDAAEVDAVADLARRAHRTPGAAQALRQAWQSASRLGSGSPLVETLRALDEASPVLASSPRPHPS